MPARVVPGSFRDPNGFLFLRDDGIYRQINQGYREDYDHLMSSRLYSTLVDAGLLIPHEEVETAPVVTDRAYKVIKPVLVDFISYPYEWSFSQLKDAALATLAIQKRAIDFGMSLKDASAYNIQFVEGRPLHIDTLSFERYEEGRPWVAYGQFCRHFLAPLTLMAYSHINLNQLLRVYIDGIPLDLASALLPVRTRFRFSLLSHLHLHARSQERHADSRDGVARAAKMGKTAFLGLIDNLETAIKKLEWRPGKTEWGDYYESTNYTSGSHEHKKKTIVGFLERLKPKNIWDLGANTGLFSRLAADRGIPTVSFDIDPAAVEKNYLNVKKGEKLILPLLLDLSNPSPGIGWKNEERMSLLERGPTDMAFALALIHHLAISNNLPLARIADFFCHVCDSLVIEFVPKADSQVKRLLATREDIFPDYAQETFESVFSERFAIQEAVPLTDSERTLYLMVKKQK